MSAGQLVVTLAFVGLLAALHLVLRAAREPESPVVTVPVGVGRTAALRDPWTRILVVAALGALAFASVAFVVSIVDEGEGEETTAPTTTAATTVPTSTARPPRPPPPPPPPPPPLRPPAGTVLAGSVTIDESGEVVRGDSRLGDAPVIVKRERGVYEVTFPGLDPDLRRQAAIRVRPANAGTRASARKIGPEAEFIVFTRDEATGRFRDRGFELAVYLPKRAVEPADGEEDEEPQLPPTK